MPPDEADRSQVLLVAVGDRTLALSAEAVREVVRASPVTPMPGAARWIVGLAAVRGAIVPVGDVLRRAGAEEVAGAAEAWFVVLDDGRRSAALTGVRPLRLAPLADAVRSPRVAGMVAGLPVRGVVRLDVVRGRSAGAPPAEAPLVDTAALLDDFFDPDGG